MRPSWLIKSISAFDRLPFGCRHDDITQSFAWSQSVACLPRGPRKACAAHAKWGGERYAARTDAPGVARVMAAGFDAAAYG
ncbi:hypothetical protein WS68_20740 [Burkholderia sp. TSV86]|nr:hypothetical protein WS68_20740 [Burkholderia sp. TSV86]